MRKNIVYLVKHEYIADEKYIQSKGIGVFSSEEMANEAIDRSIKLNGFKDYPRSCYKIRKYVIDDYSYWLNGLKEEDLMLLC